MFARNSSGELIKIDVENTINEKQLYNTLWGIKYKKRTSQSTSISVDHMKNYLNSKCFSL